MSHAEISTGNSNHKIKFHNPFYQKLGGHIVSSAQRKLPMMVRDEFKGQNAIVCGSAPSLLKPETLRKLRKHIKQGWKIVACKEGIELLRKRKVSVHFSVSMDPTDTQHLKTYLDDGITYLIASSCHPTLFDHVLNDGRPVRVFHSACGWNGHIRNPGTGEVAHITETDLYKNLFPNADVMCGGFTVVNRALSCAKYMGFEKVIIAGADFGWRAGENYYAEGAKQKAGNEGIEMSDQGRVDGKEWLTRPDLLASAVTVAKMKKSGHIYAIWGDSLAAALAKKDTKFLDECCQINRSDGPPPQPPAAPLSEGAPQFIKDAPRFL